jgi:hypothetical protein
MSRRKPSAASIQREHEIRTLWGSWEDKDPVTGGYKFFLFLRKDRPDLLDGSHGDPWQELKSRIGVR